VLYRQIRTFTTSLDRRGPVRVIRGGRCLGLEVVRVFIDHLEEAMPGEVLPEVLELEWEPDAENSTGPCRV
jgi:hypothetical protein